MKSSSNLQVLNLSCVSKIILFVHLGNITSRSDSLQSMHNFQLFSYFIATTTGALEGHPVPPVFKAGDSVIAVVKSSAEVSVTVGIKDEQQQINRHLKTTPAGIYLKLQQQKNHRQTDSDFMLSNADYY